MSRFPCEPPREEPKHQLCTLLHSAERHQDNRLNTARGASKPVKPAQNLPLPLSTMSAATPTGKESRTRIDFTTREHHHEEKWKFFQNQAPGAVHAATVEPSIVRKVCRTSLHDTGTSTTVQLRLHKQPGQLRCHWVRRKTRRSAHSPAPLPPQRNSQAPSRSPR